MKNFVSKLLKYYDIILNIVFVFLVLFTAFVIVYYALPEKTSQVIAKAFSFTDNPELAAKLMDYINGFTLGAGFPLWFSQKATISRYVNNASNAAGVKTTQTILSENINIMEAQLEYQKAEAYRFMGNPVIPAKARLHYKEFLTKLDESEKSIQTLKSDVLPDAQAKEKKKARKKEVKEDKTDNLDGLV